MTIAAAVLIASGIVAFYLAVALLLLGGYALVARWWRDPHDLTVTED
jgi:hypothetical protein